MMKNINPAMIAAVTFFIALYEEKLFCIRMIASSHDGMPFNTFATARLSPVTGVVSTVAPSQTSTIALVNKACRDFASVGDHRKQYIL